MCADRTTETISHFIGLFELKTEEIRLRDAYEEFTLERKAAEIEALREEPVKLTEKLELSQTPDHAIRTPQTASSQDAGIAAAPLQPGPAPADIPAAANAVQSGALASGQIIGGGASPYVLQLQIDFPFPGSMVTFTQQYAFLSDNDILGTGDFRDVLLHAQDLTAIAELADSLHAPGPAGDTFLPTPETAEALSEALMAFTGAAPASVTTYVAMNDDVPLSILNGSATSPEDLPVWKDILPEHHRDPLEEDTGGGMLPKWALPDTFANDPNMPEGHELITGGNLLANEALVQVSWIDAPVFAVGGAWRTVDVVSQVAFASDVDTGTVPGSGRDGTQIFQSIEFETTARLAPWHADKGDGPSGPDHILLDQINGDLLVSNTITQVIKLLDNDMFSMAITGTNSLFALGDNTVFNLVEMFQAGFAYDMIIVTGDMIAMNSIHQTAILLDDDRIEGSGSLVAQPTFATLENNGTATGGTAVPGDGITGLDDSALRVEDFSSHSEDPENEAPGGGTGNVIFNMARLMKTGIDSAAELTESIREMLSESGADLDGLKEKLMNDPVLAGLEQARVLRIDGDLIQANIINQTIHALDRDDILLGKGAPHELSLTANANALLNAATVSSFGVDSKIMAKQGTYSDLLIHQASLMDSDEPADGARSDLVSEAVAFLMDEIATDTLAKTDHQIAAPDMAADSAGYDALTGLIA